VILQKPSLGKFGSALDEENQGMEAEVGCTAAQFDVVGAVRGVKPKSSSSVFPDPPDTLRGLASLAQMQAELLDRPRDLLGE
jgi:hypothetical protein